MIADKGDKHDARKKDFDPSSGRARKDSRYIDQLKKSADIRKASLADTHLKPGAPANRAPRACFLAVLSARPIFSLS